MAYMPEDRLKTRYRRKKKMESKGGEVRRVHIVYFLSRNGRIEHPHLIRVHHVNRHGVRLRDVKRWLGELRGKEMPETFSWSYKRRYKNGYVWQDLLDDDLITPISDNEYVLKGSEISSSPFDHEPPPSSLLEPERPPTDKKLPEKPRDTAEKSAELINPRTEEEEEEETTSREKASVSSSSSSSSSLSSSSSSSSFSAAVADEKPSTGTGPAFSKSKSVSSHIFRNLLSCRAVDTDDSALTKTTTTNTSTCNHSANYEHPSNDGVKKGELVCKFDTMGGRDSLTLKDEQEPRRKGFSGLLRRLKKTTESGNQKKAAPVIKPISEPYCSQCGRPFKPEKLHYHMTSCRGLKGNAGKKTVTRKKPTAPAPAQPTNLFLTHR
ncbi:hypothetical protein H6P81_011357 [Aristolochia fimbriata]|uniref:SOSEKI DIX-like domain-containing protein n=1 Tax=Aristolochia fimbriata TaxID=158543 RepID=A0AAV7EUS7_ARIFI|nr:hypothetical protein H6P81_011357 [Aristolochia fimbriata]